MKWALNLGQIAGIQIKVHATFPLIVLWIAGLHWFMEGTGSAVFRGIIFLLLLFGCVVLHELGHSLMARHFGVQTRDITLLPIGGVARLERMPDLPHQEFLVAIAGPAVNVVIATVLFFWLKLVSPGEPLLAVNLFEGSFAARLMIVNVFLVLFNLLPAFPMDGGRIFRSILATRLSYARATRIAATVGQGMALLFGFIGFFSNPFFIFIALFVWIGASQEASMAEIKSTLGGVPVAQAMVTDFRVLSPNDDLERAVQFTLTGSQQDFPVLEDDQVVGILTRADLMAALARDGKNLPVREIMRRDFSAMDASDLLEPAFAKLQQSECRTIPVLRFGRLIGVLTLENIGHFIMIQSALRESKQAS